MESRDQEHSTRTVAARWLTSAVCKRAPRPRRRGRWSAHSGETLEGRTLLSAMAVAEFGGDSPSDQASPVRATANSSGDTVVASNHSRAPAHRAAHPSASSRRNRQTSVDAVAHRQRYIEVLIFIDSGPLNTGHADIAVTDGHGTTVYGQHGRGQGNGGFEDSAFRRRTLDAYLRQESPSGFRVYVSRIPVAEQQFREIRQYLDHRWQNDDDFHLLDDNCSQNVGYVLKRWDLLSKWGGGPNAINDDDFQLPEGDLYNDFIRGDRTWLHRDAGYLAPTPGGASLFDSVQDKPSTRVRPAHDSSGGTGSSGRGGGTSSSSSGRRGGGGGRSSRVVSGMPDDAEGGDEADWFADVIRGHLPA